MSKFKDIQLTRITVPVDYYLPSTYGLNSLKEEWAKQGLSDDEIKEALLRREKWGAAENATTINFIGETLVSHSAQKVYLLDFGRHLTGEIVSAMPSYLRSRIEWVDKKKQTQKSVYEMLNPIAEDIAPIWEKIRKQNGANENDFNGHEHGYCLLGEFLTTLSVAAKYETEADGNLSVVSEAVYRIKRQISSPESRALIARIEGVLMCYSLSTPIPYIIPKDGTIPADLLQDLLDDAKMKSLSESRYMLGIPSKFSIAMLEIKRKLKEILAQPRNRKKLRIASKLGNFATKQINFDLPEINVRQVKAFSPPFVALDEIKPPCLSTRRKLLDSEPPTWELLR